MSQLDLFAAEPLTDSERHWHKHMARVFIQQARAHVRHRGYAATLLEWAANRRRQAGAA